MKKITIYILIIISLCVNSYAYELKIINNKLSIKAYKTPLQQLLQEMVQMGIKVKIDPAINPEITANFENRDVDKGLKAILKPYDRVIFWKKIKGPINNITKLSEIQIYKFGGKNLIEPIKFSKNLEVVKDETNGTLYIRKEMLIKLDPEIDRDSFLNFLEEIDAAIIDSNVNLGIYRIKFSNDVPVPTIAKILDQMPGISKAEPNYAYSLFPPGSTESPVSHQTWPSNMDLTLTGEPVAVLDTGLDVSLSGAKGVIAALDALNPNQDISDFHGHGTQMSLLASGAVKPTGVSSESSLSSPVVAIKAFDENMMTSNHLLLESIDFAIENNAKVISLSWGSEVKSAFIEEAMDYAKKKGLIIVAAAGNEPTGKAFYPAGYESVMGIGALNSNGEIWENSNYGDIVDLYAPGFAKFQDKDKNSQSTYAGTSIATAFVANLISQYLKQNPNATEEEISKHLKTVCPTEYKK